MNKLFDVLLCISLCVLSEAVQALSPSVPIEYPKNAVDSCIEGYVRVEYTFSEDGQPQDIRILEASPEGIFEEVTRNNLSHWRYPDRAGETEEKTIEYKLEDIDHCDL